jgi:hypothetical protein
MLEWLDSGARTGHYPIQFDKTKSWTLQLRLLLFFSCTDFALPVLTLRSRRSSTQRMGLMAISTTLSYSIEDVASILTFRRKVFVFLY